ncbi:MAG: rhodanese-like domain-containing protein, partial [Verrucomicrobiota bacterium]
AKLVPLTRFGELAPALLTIDKPLIVYCHHGMRSLHATNYLREQGASKTWSLAGGIDLWSSQIDPDIPRY